MTKNEIIRELSCCSPCRVKSLFVIYHDYHTDARYTFSYEHTADSSVESCREFVRVLLSLYKLRKYVMTIFVSYFSDENGKCLTRTYDSYNRVNSVSEFIKTIKK